MPPAVRIATGRGEYRVFSKDRWKIEDLFVPILGGVLDLLPDGAPVVMPLDDTPVHDRKPLGAEMENPATLVVTYRAGDAKLTLRYLLHGDHVEVRLPPPDAGDEPETPRPAPPTPVGVKKEDLPTLVQDAVNRSSIEQAVALNAEFGVKRVSELPDEKVAEYARRLEAL